jgi:hypothetical protein
MSKHLKWVWCGLLVIGVYLAWNRPNSPIMAAAPTVSEPFHFQYSLLYEGELLPKVKAGEPLPTIHNHR